jgi:hypothetical protein
MYNWQGVTKKDLGSALFTFIMRRCYPSEVLQGKAFLSTILWLFVVIILQSTDCYGENITTGIAMNCTSIQAKLDQYPTLFAMNQKLCVEPDSFFDAMFECLKNNTTQQRLPTTIISNGRSYIYGRGWAPNTILGRLPFFQRIQAMILNRVWQGKIFRLETNRRVVMVNIIPIALSTVFEGEVYNLPSIVDGGDAVIVDYRIDATVPLLSKSSAVLARDELREITWRGAKSEIYLGRGYLFNRGKSQIMNDTAWQLSANWNDGPYFLIDVRAVVQNELPRWAIRKYL